MKCTNVGCNNMITNRSKSGLCKKHYSYLWKNLNKDRAANHSKISYLRKREEYIKRTAESRSLARKINIHVKLRDSLRRRLNNALKNSQKTGSAIRDLGCSIEELKNHLEAQFQPGMTWGNYGKFGWHVDHIKPLSKFDLTDSGQLKEACSYQNLKPMWWQDNLSKGDRYELR